jgi:serine/threonine-protein kinase TTK/MPS1
MPQSTTMPPVVCCTAFKPVVAVSSHVTSAATSSQLSGTVVVEANVPQAASLSALFTAIPACQSAIQPAVVQSSSSSISQQSTAEKNWTTDGLMAAMQANGFKRCQGPAELPACFKDCKVLSINGRPYLLLNLIGKGGSGKVFEALGPDRKVCAVKCVSLDNADEEMIDGYRNEIELLQSLQKNRDEIVQLIDYTFDELGYMLYVVMERGEMDLEAFLRAGKLRLDVLRRQQIGLFWVQMLYAVRALHQRDIVHADLKPANFILVGGVLKLIDFGIAKKIQSDRTSITRDVIVGSFNYISPEAVGNFIDLGGRVSDQNKPNMKISTKSDVWSLGCILYYLVYGRLPFGTISHLALKLEAIVNPNHTISFLDTDLPHVVDVLRRCLDRNPRSRPTVDELLQHPFVTG